MCTITSISPKVYRVMWWCMEQRDWPVTHISFLNISSTTQTIMFTAGRSNFFLGGGLLLLQYLLLISPHLCWISSRLKDGGLDSLTLLSLLYLLTAWPPRRDGRQCERAGWKGIGERPRPWVGERGGWEADGSGSVPSAQQKGDSRWPQAPLTLTAFRETPYHPASVIRF